MQKRHPNVYFKCITSLQAPIPNLDNGDLKNTSVIVAMGIHMSIFDAFSSFAETKGTHLILLPGEMVKQNIKDIHIIHIS